MAFKRKLSFKFLIYQIDMPIFTHISQYHVSLIELIIKLAKYVFKNHLENIAEIDDFDQLKDYKKFRKDKLPIFSVLNQNDLDSIKELIIYVSNSELFNKRK